MRLRIGSVALWALGWAALAVAGPAAAQDVPDTDIDGLIDQSRSPGGALATARRQEAEGDLTGAAATLERALLTHDEGETARVRLFYAALLCRLDDDAGAAAELDLLDGRGIRDADWAQVQAACDGVRRPAAGPARRRDGLSGEVSAGLAYDGDAAGAVLVRFDLPGATPSDDGLSFVGSAQLDGRLPLGGAFAYGALAGITRNNLSGPDVDYQIGDFVLGLGIEAGGAELSAGGVVRHAIVGGDRFLTEVGGEAEVAIPTGPDRIAIRAEVADQDYAGSFPAFSRDGARFDLSLAYQGRNDDGLNYNLGAGYEHKSAETTRLGYSGVRAFFGLRQTLSRQGAYGTLATTLRHLEYADAFGFPPITERRYFGRAALGLPLSADGVAAEAAASYTSRAYNGSSGLRDHDSLGAELRLVWTFGN